MKMKKLSLFAVALFASATSFAQTTTPVVTPNPAIKGQMKDLRQDERAYNKEKAQVKQDINKGDLKDAQSGIATLKTERTGIQADAKILKAEGVANPVKLAGTQIRNADKKDINADKNEIKADKKAEQADIKKGDLADAQAEQKKIKTERKDLRKDVRIARRDGIKHPMRKK